MSTLQGTPPEHTRITGRRGTALALTTLIAIGLALLILTPTYSRTGKPTPARSGAQPHSHAPASVKSAAQGGAFLDPTSDAFPAAQIPYAIAKPLGYFRDPATHAFIAAQPSRPTAQPARSSRPTLASVLRSLTPAERRYVRGILALTPAQLRSAYGTVK